MGDAKAQHSLLIRTARQVVEGLDQREIGRADTSGRVGATWWHVRNTGLFSSLPEGELEALARSAELLRCARRQHMTLGGGGSVYVMTLGGAKLCRSGAFGRRLVEGVIGPGDLFGRVADRDAEDTYHLEAIEDSRVLCIPRAEFKSLLARQPNLACTVIQVVEHRERVLRRRLESLVFKDVSARVAEALVELARDYGEPCEHGMAVDVRITQQDLGDLVGASRQMVNRVLRRLTLGLYVVRKGKFLCILHYGRLKRLAEGAAEDADARA